MFPARSPASNPPPPLAKADLIAESVIQQYERLPRKRKPAARDNGIHEWVPLSGIVAERHGEFRCLSLATGMKCLPASKLPEVQGNGIHDWHAEILAIRAFNHFLLEECKAMLQGKESDILHRRNGTNDGLHGDTWHGQPFGLNDDVALYMYCSEAPCGDASMELTMAAQDDPTPWTTRPATTGPESVEPQPVTLPGRGYFSRLGIVRRKPSRPDAAATLSKSCSDKLALKQCTSILSSLTSLLVSPEYAYMHAIVIPASQYHETAIQRCFSMKGRMNSVAGKAWDGGYIFHQVDVVRTGLEFGYSRATMGERGKGLAPSNLAATWTCLGLEEGLLGGVLQGRKGFGDRSASGLSRKRMWVLASEIAEMLEDAGGIPGCIRASDYGLMKNHQLLTARRRAKAETKQEALIGWVPNGGDDGFGLGSVFSGSRKGNVVRKARHQPVDLLRE